jgi:predicted methyltransferase
MYLRPWIASSLRPCAERSKPEFKFDSESSILANPADPRTAKVFDQTIRGHTDQFILKFRKPK